MWRSDLARFRRVFELVMRADGMREHPAVVFQFPDEVSTFYGVYYTHSWGRLSARGPKPKTTSVQAVAFKAGWGLTLILAENDLQKDSQKYAQIFNKKIYKTIN